MSYKIVIVDDEPLAIEVLSYYLKEETDFIIIGSFTNPVQALAFLNTNTTDILFVDINMAVLNGLELINQLKTKPLIVFTTAHKQFLQDGFDNGILDYLQKPIKKDRLAITINRTRKELAKDRENIEVNKQLLIRSTQKEFYINSNDILFVKAVKDYSLIYLNNDRNVMDLGSLKFFIEKYALTTFLVRVHRSYIVPVWRIKEIHSGGVIPIREYKIPIGRKYKAGVLALFKNNQNL